VEEGFFRQQIFFRLSMSWVVHTAIHWANGCTLWLIVEADALGAFVTYDVIQVRIDGLMFFIGFHNTRYWMLAASAESGSIREFPPSTAFIDGVVGAFRLTCTAIDAFVCNHDGHGKYL